MVDFEGKTWRYVLIAFLIIGMLIFAKQVPDMIGKIFGIDMKSQGGIAGRLGNMAGVGNVAKKHGKRLEIQLLLLQVLVRPLVELYHI